MPSTLPPDLPSCIENWPSLARAQDAFRKAEENHEWVFRGVDDESNSHDVNDLRTTLELVAQEFSIAPDQVPDLEQRLILEFMRRYHLYAVEPPPRTGDTLDWLALMRHHGAPSRFLDATFSFLVAAYFAIERMPKGMPTVWAINKSWLTRKTAEIVAASGLSDRFETYARVRDGAAFRDVFLLARPILVSAVSAFRMNQRLTIQQGVFLCPGDVTKTFAQNLIAMGEVEDHVKAIPIDRDARPELLVALSRANINRATLFPGLDGFAASLWTRAAFLKRLRSMEDSGARRAVNLDIRALELW